LTRQRARPPRHLFPGAVLELRAPFERSVPPASNAGIASVHGKSVIDNVSK